MRVKKILSAFAAGALTFSLLASGTFTASAADDYIISDTDSKAKGDWGQAITVQGADLDRSIFKEGCTVVVEHDEGFVELILQSWNDPGVPGCDKEIWARVSPASDEGGIAQFTYADIKKAFIDDNNTTWDCLMAYHVGVESADTVIHKAYIIYKNTGAEEDKKPAKDENTDKPSSGSTDSDAPTLSFDMNKWGDYVKLTPDASIAGISLSQTTTGQYQGATLNVSVNMTSDLEGKYPTFAGGLNDEDGNPLYPEAAEAAEAENDDAFVKMGLEFQAEDFGLEKFDGCTITFKYLFNEDAADILLNGGIYIYSSNEDYEALQNPMVQKVNTITRENIDTYTNGFVSVPTNAECTKIIIEIPLLKGYTGDILRIDNFTITLPGDKGTVANLDGYNDTAKPMNEYDGKIKITGSSNSNSTSSVAEEKGGTKVGTIIIIVLVVIVVLAVVVGVVIFLLKNRSKYY